jgi:TolB-like protein/KaiC/GvpD/RAD55 family RecA-like ATPase
LDSRAPLGPVSTGYANLDKSLYGGLPSNCAVVLTSPSFGERDLLVGNFLETGAKNGEITFYVTIDPRVMKSLAEEFPSNFYLFVCNPEADTIVKEASNVFKLKGVENLTDISIALASTIRKLEPSLKGPRRMCIDLVSDVLLQHHAVQTRRWLIALIAELKSTGFTTLATIDPQMHPSEELYAILGLFDGEISLFEKETGRGFEKFLKIKKMSSHEYQEEELSLKREDLNIPGIKGWLSGNVSRVKPQESNTGQAVLDKHRIAVLPFVNMSPDPNDEYFADGMTEEVISTVSGISGLSVISRTSVMSYKGTAKKVKEIGRELEVGSVLEGSFRKAGDKIRVTTQLIDVATDGHLWAQNYDRNLDDVFEVQSDVAKQVAEALRGRILSAEKERIEKKPTENTTAYALYLRGRYYWNKRGLEDVKRALEYFELAVQGDPDFALGYVGISDCCLILRNTWGFEPDKNRARARAMANKALELDPELAEAHVSNAALLRGEYDFKHAEEEFRRAIELKPSYATAHQWYCILLTHQMRWDDALEHIEKAVELDPLSPIIHFNHGAYYFYKRDYARAIQPLRRAVELGYAHAHRDLAYTYGMMKRFDDMKREFAAWVETVKDSVPLANLHADLLAAYYMDDKKTLSRLLPELEIHFHGDRWPSAYRISAFHIALGETDRGFEWLERSYLKREFDLPSIKIDPQFDGVRTDPRYLDLLKRLGLG